MNGNNKTPRSALRLLVMLCIGFALPVSAGGTYPGTTGKIKGRVIEAQTGEPMPGVNVVIDGTTLGAATDLDGFYIILNVPPGRHNLRASLIGYAVTSVPVQVTVDLTTTQDFSLSQEAIEGEEVTIVATRPVVVKDRTNSAAFVDAEQIAELPVQTVNDLVQLQAGVVVDASGGIHIRGGRTNEVAYLVDGVSVSNQYSSDGGSLVAIESGTIQQLQVISGTFNAEYGQAQSGVINIITKDPEKHYSGSVTAYIGDRVSNDNATFLGVSEVRPLNERNLEGNITGPIPGLSNLGFYFFGRNVKDDGFLYGERLARPEDAWTVAVYETWFRRRFPDDPDVQKNIIPVPDSLLTGDSAFVPMSPRERLFLNFKLNYRMSPMIRLAYSFFFEDVTGRIYDDNFRFTPDALKNLERQSQIHILNLNHTFNARAFYSASLSYTTFREDSFLFTDLTDSRLQTVSSTRDRFHLGGTKQGIDRVENDKLLARADLTWQVDNYNLLKFGGEIVSHRLYFRSLSPEFSDIAGLGNNFFPPDATLPFDEFLEQSREALIVEPQRTASGETGFSDLEYEHRPLELAFYAQDKLELNELIVNLGVRFDLFRPDHLALVNPRVNPVVGSVSLLSASPTEEAETSMQVSPRFGIAYPVSPLGVFHVAYGHFFKTPPFELIYDNSEYKVNGIDGPIVGNPNLKPQQTTSYEIGLQQEIFRNVGLDVTMFYSDYKNLIGLEVIRQIGNFSSYLRRTNIANGANRGFTVAIDKRSDGGLISGSLDYTFQVGEGTESDPDNIAIIQTAGAAGGVVQDVEKQFLPLDWDQRHTMNGTLTLGKPGNWVVSFIGRLATGQPYTPEFLRLNVKTKFKNTENKPLRHNLDLFLRKTARIGSQSISLFLRVYNLFDQANEVVVFPITGRAGQDHRFPVQEQLDDARLVGLFTLADVDTHQNWFSEPRRVQLGFSMNF
ncbi:MAG: TonB-dependent receptor [Bacteroidetes bacterium]|nr:MAG: TonB-dependent receptor [Bacteroidota bacterium]